MNDDKKPVPPVGAAVPDKLTRVPVRHLFFVDHMMHEGAAAVSNTKCYPDPPGANVYWSAEYIPAWQAFEVTFHPGLGQTPRTDMIPAHRVARWTRLL